MYKEGRKAPTLEEAWTRIAQSLKWSLLCMSSESAIEFANLPMCVMALVPLKRLLCNMLPWPPAAIGWVPLPNPRGRPYLPNSCMNVKYKKMYVGFPRLVHFDNLSINTKADCVSSLTLANLPIEDLIGGWQLARCPLFQEGGTLSIGPDVPLPLEAHPDLVLEIYMPIYTGNSVAYFVGKSYVYT